MPLADDDESVAPPGPQIRVAGSLATELDWVMHAAWSPRHREEHPNLARLFAEGSEMGQRVRSAFGEDETTGCGLAMELSIVAHHSGRLFALDPDELLGHLEEMCATAPVELPLASETASDRRAINRRLRLLRSSPRLRRGYVEMVGDLWAAVGGEWRRQGRPAVEADVAARRELVRRSAPWQEVARHSQKPFHQDGLVTLASGLGPDGVLAVVPAYFGCRSGYMDLSGTLLITIAAATGAAQARVRTEALARRLRTISDPTRLAILELLRSVPSTITELAGTFGLAQPTVSNHVKVLRDAGLVEASPSEGRRRLMVRQDVLRDVILSLEGMVAGGESTAPEAASERTPEAVSRR